MSAPILTTKLYIPPLRPELVPRPRLIERLNLGMARKVTLVSAPAGYGKTTLLSEWVHQDGVGVASQYGGGVTPPLPVAWLSLDEADDDPTHFLSYLISAMQTVVPGAGEGILEALHSQQPPPAQTVLISLINELTAVPCDSGRCCLLGLVLDDYHRIDNPEIHDAVAFLLDHLPPPPEGMHLVITSRKDPLLPLPRWRAAGQMTEVREADLRFTHSEASDFLNQAIGLDLSGDDVATLAARTEGWITGLQLAALSMRDLDSAGSARFISAFAGDDRHVVDYLLDEVLAQRPQGTKDFLLQTSILERLTGPLCNAVTGQRGGQDLLEMLEQANLFVIPLDNRRQWYRYHHMFADLLRQRALQTVGPGAVAAYHVRASEWFEQNDFVAEAVNHALAAKDLSRAARLVELVGFTLLTRSEWGTLSSWLNAMPEEFVRGRPWLCIYQCWMLRRAGRLDAVEQRVQDAERALEANPATIPTAEQDLIRGHLASLRAYLALDQGQIQEAMACARQALEHFPPGYIIRGVTGLILGIASRMSGDLAAASRAFAEARSMGEATDNDFLTQIAIWDLAYVQILRGELRQAMDTFCGALSQASELGERRTQFTGQPYVYIGSILREWNELEAAISYLMQGIELCDPGRLLDALTDGHVGIARARLAQRDMDGALDALQEAEQVLQVPNPPPVSVMRMQDCQVRLWLAQGDLAAAVRWAKESSLSPGDDFDFLRELEHLTLARVLVALGQRQPEETYLADAQELLARLREMAETSGWMGKMIEILALQAFAAEAQGDRGGALRALERALSLGEPQGYVRTFVDEGPPMAVLLREVRGQRSAISQDYLDMLLAAFGEEAKDERRRTKTNDLSIARPPSSPVPRPSFAVVEPLSERELEVLRLIAEGLTNREIAERLYLAISTVKVHTRNIYGKLGVHSRTQAVARAQQLKLL